MFKFARTWSNCVLFRNTLKQLTFYPTCFRNISSKNTEEYKRILVQNLNISEDTALEILKRFNRILLIPSDQIIDSCKILKEINDCEESVLINAEMLRVHPSVLSHRIVILKEFGVPVVYGDFVRNFLQMVKFPVDIFKAYVRIDPSANIAENLLKTVFKEPPQEIYSKQTSELMTVKQCYKECLRYYLRVTFQMSDEEVEKSLAAYPKMQLKSFTMMHETVKFLQEKVGLSLQRIRKHNYLLYSSVEHMEQGLALKTLGGSCIRKLYLKCPKLLTVKVERIQETMNILKIFGVPDIAIEKCPEIFTLNPATVKQRLQHILDSPDFRMLINHPKILRLAHYQNSTHLRLEYLKEINLKPASLHTLLSAKNIFEKFAKARVDISQCQDVLYYLEAKLKQDKKSVKKKLSKHPNWRHVPLDSVDEVYEYLSKMYTSQQIFDSLYILLYPLDYIQEAMVKAQVSKIPGVDSLTPNDTLNLAVYYLEKNYHFSGDGIWTKDMPNYQIRMSKKMLAYDIQSCTSDEFPMNPKSFNDNIAYEYIEVPEVPEETDSNVNCRT